MIDLKAGRAVHARGGAREHYEPVQSPLMQGEGEGEGEGDAKPGDAAALARGYRARGDIAGIYVADLDAISGGAPQDLAAIAAAGLPMLVDAGVRTAERAVATAGLGVRVVVGLETLPSFTVLSTIVSAIGGERTVFSLDLRNGVPLVPGGTDSAGGSPIDLARQAVACGVCAVIVLDVARVGGAQGVDFELMGNVRRALPVHEVELMVGGGVRGDGDLTRLAALGCDGALVATSLLRNV